MFMRLLFFLGLLMFIQVGHTQIEKNLEDYSVQIEGTSTLHNWLVQVNEAKGVMTIDSVGEIEEVYMAFKVESMDGGRGPAMNDKIKKALGNDTHPWVEFNSEKISVNKQGQYEVNGEINIGGEIRPITVEVEKTENRYSGQLDMTFSLFDIVPPSAMFGQIKCGDNLAINFELTF